MRKLACVLMLLVSLGAVCSAHGKVPYLGEEEIKLEVERSLGIILDLWRDGKYDDLYEKTLTGGKLTREAFSARLSAAPLRPACCWEKLQNVRVTLKSDNRAVVRARIGLEGHLGSSVETRDIKLNKEDGTWRMSRSDILFLAGGAKGKRSKGARRKRRYTLQRRMRDEG